MKKKTDLMSLNVKCLSDRYLYFIDPFFSFFNKYPK